ncbi:MAG TPA: 2-oxo-4-hydroxy-4-carboxy-5-ureidoimidazoline decarboxylase [Opitutaceae bacterium]
MRAPPKPTLGALNSGGREAFVAALGPLFEHSPWVASETYDRRPFADAESLYGALCSTMRAASPERQLALVRAHPDLAGRLAQAGELTASSAHEQSVAGLDRLGPEETAEISRLNDAYKARFGFPFVICARLNAKAAILAAMRARLGHGPEAELSTALNEIAKIAQLRLNDSLAKEN